MGARSSKTFTNIPHFQEKNSNIDAPSYLLGKNQFILNKKTPPSINTDQSNSSLKPTKNQVLPISKINLSSRDNIMDTSFDVQFKCDQCGMVFRSDASLYKHKMRFCIGVKDSGIGRKVLYSDDDESSTHANNHHVRDKRDAKQSPPRKVIRHRSPMQKKHENTNELKRHRSNFRSVDDFEDPLYNDTSRGRKYFDYLQEQENIYNEILLEYERLKNQEKEFLLEMYNLQAEPPSKKYTDSYFKQNNHSSNDHQTEQYNDLQRRNIRLERERRIIQDKLEELISNNYPPPPLFDYSPHKLLREMKEQQDVNERALEFLRTRLTLPLSSTTTAGLTSKVPSLPYIDTYGTRSRGNRSESVRSFRNLYLQSGGHDANVIARYSDLEHKLHGYENYPWTKDYPEPLNQALYENRSYADPVNERLKLVNEENQRLQNELIEMHRKFDVLNTRTKQLEITMGRNQLSNSDNFLNNPSTNSGFNDQNQLLSRETHRQHLNPSNRNSQQLSLSPLDKRITPRASPAISLLASNMNRLRDPFAAQSYDPIGGFVIFFDYILNLPSATEQCCVVTCIHHPKSGLGEPSTLEPVKCNKHVDERTGAPTQIALIATKQPVPRCPPQQALTIVLEIQTSIANEDLKAIGWTKLPLFDSKNRLLSGRWKVPLKSLPIHYDDSLAIISTLPSYEQAELYYRLVNAQDGDDQSNIPLSPNARDQYNYPLQYRNAS